MINVYEASGHNQMLVENYGADKSMLDKMFNIDSVEPEAKVLEMAAIVENIEVELAAVDVFHKRLARKKKSLKNSLDNIRQYMADTMLNRDIKQVKDPRFTISRQTRKSVFIKEDAKVDEYMVENIEYKLDSKKLKEDLLDGVYVEGCSIVEKNGVVIR